MAVHRLQAWREGIEAVAKDGFTGFRTATGDLPDAVAVPVTAAAPDTSR